MDSETKQRLISVIGWGGYSASIIIFLFGFSVYLEGLLSNDGIPLMFWGVGLAVATALALYVLDGRTPITRETPAKLLSPSTPYWRFALLALGAAAVGFAIAYNNRYGATGDFGASLVLLSVLFAVLFAIMAVVVKRR